MTPSIFPASPRKIARKFGLGRLAYLLWHAPIAWVRKSRREGGPCAQWITALGRRGMIAAAGRLTPQPAAAAGASEVCFLTGRRFWFQTAFCAWSLREVSGCDLSFTFHDDGSFDVPLRAEAQRLFPGCRIVTPGDTESLLDRFLPESQFPALRSQRRTYIHLRKLVDFHAGHHGWRVVLDSDMLFFRRPDMFMDWLASPDRPVHMVDVQNAYGYPYAALLGLVGEQVPARVNVGICGLDSDSLDWDRIESWCARLLSEFGTSYYLEQALVALVLVGKTSLRLPQADYCLLPDDAECRRPTAALHHYVDLSKRGYYRHAWRSISARSTG